MEYGEGISRVEVDLAEADGHDHRRDGQRNGEPAPATWQRSGSATYVASARKRGAQMPAAILMSERSASSRPAAEILAAATPSSSEAWIGTTTSR